MTNGEVRAWYREQIALIPVLVAQWEAEGVALPDRSRRAFELRHQARIAARNLMEDPLEVAMLRQRDLVKHGHPDGPTFESLFHKAKDAGLTDGEAYAKILASSTSTDEATNRKFAR